MRSWRVSAQPCSRWRCSPFRSAISALRQSEERSRWAAVSHLSERPVESSVFVRVRQKREALRTNCRARPLREFSETRCSGLRLRASGSGLQAPGFRLRASGSGLQAPGFRLRLQAPGFRLRASGSGLQAPGFAPGFRLRASGSGLQAPGFRLRASGSGLQAPGFRLRASGSGLQAPGFRLRFRLRASGSGLQAPGFRLRASGSGFRLRASGSASGSGFRLRLQAPGFRLRCQEGSGAGSIDLTGSEEDHPPRRQVLVRAHQRFSRPRPRTATPLAPAAAIFTSEMVVFQL